MKVNKKTKMEVNEMFVVLYSLNNILFNPNGEGNKKEWLDNMSRYDFLKEQLGDGEASETIKNILKVEKEMFQCEDDSNEYAELWKVSSLLKDELEELINISDYQKMLEIEEQMEQCVEYPIEYLELWARLTLLQNELNKEVK